MFSFDAELGEMRIYDEIGPAWWGLIDADTVIDALSKMDGKPVTVRLNTPGGSVDEGIAIYNALKRHKGGVTTMVDSLAASMGSYLLQAGERRIVASNAMVMIHDPWTIAYGNAEELRKNADVLDYAERSGKTEDEVKAIMAEETWYAGKEIVDAGWADEIGIESDVEPVTAGLHKMAKNAPAALFEKREKIKQVLDRGLYARRDAAKVAQQKVAAMVKM
jgi:ATP-dependent protease ClpP protease subunit